MGKGLPRSSARGAPQRQEIIKHNVVLRNLNVAITDPGAAVAFAAAVIGDLPEGNILLLGAIANLKFTKGNANIIDAFNANFSIGSAPTADNALAGAEVDLLPSTAVVGVAGVSAVTRAANATQVMLDNTDGSLEINLNLTVADASISANSSLIVTGEVYLAYIVLGDD